MRLYISQSGAQPYIEGQWIAAGRLHTKDLVDDMQAADVAAVSAVLKNAAIDGLTAALDAKGALVTTGTWIDPTTGPHVGEPLPKPLAPADQTALAAVLATLNTYETTTLAPAAATAIRIHQLDTELQAAATEKSTLLGAGLP